MTQPSELTTAEREEFYREFHAEHIKRQTSALESIRAMMVFITILGVLAVVGTIAGAAAAFQ